MLAVQVIAPVGHDHLAECTASACKLVTHEEPRRQGARVAGHHLLGRLSRPRSRRSKAAPVQVGRREQHTCEPWRASELTM